MLRPTGITANRQTSRVNIGWNDDHQSEYSFTLLRLACPCAECRGGHEQMGGPPAPEVFLQPEKDDTTTRLVNLELVGSYAVTFAWEDGHHYGIYNWNFLRQLCPCPVCRAG